MTEESVRDKENKGRGILTQLQGRDRLIFFFICLLTVLLPVLYPAIQGKGFYHLADDFDNQMIPFLFNFRNAFASGANTWLWNLDLGTPAIYGYGYYGMGSLFTWPVLLFPQTAVPYLVAGLVVAKYLTACYAAQNYLRRFTLSPRTAAAGALLYAFSGLQSTNITFYCFHDVTAVFPLLLIAAEKVFRRNTEKGPAIREGIFLALAVAVNCLTNYVFFVQSALALVIYFLFRVEKVWRSIVRAFSRFFLYSLLGIGLAGILYLPSMLYIMGNRRNGPSVLGGSPVYDLTHILYILKGFLLPPDAMMDETCLIDFAWLSANCYLPFVGMVLVIAYLFRKRDWLQKLLLFLILLSFFPWGNGFFLMFTISYCRWWYFLILMMALASSRVLENLAEYPLKRAALLQLILLVLWTAAVFVMRDPEGGSVIYHKGRLVLMIVFSVVSVIGLLTAVKLSEKKNASAFRPILTGIIVCAALMLLFTEYLYRKASPVPAEDYENTCLAARELPAIPDAYRYRNYNNPLILYGSMTGINGIGSYSSTVSSSIVDFDDLFGYWHESLRLNKNRIAGLPELLGGKYLVLGEPEDEEYFPEAVLNAEKKVIKEFEENGRKWTVYEMEACPVGYAVDTVISQEELMKLPVEMRGLGLLYAPVISADAAAAAESSALPAGVSLCTAEDVLREIRALSPDTEGDALFTHPAVSEFTGRNTQARIAEIYRDSTGFGGTTDYAEERLVFFSIPYDEAWQITIDGQEATPIDSGGLMLLTVPAGDHRIQAVYHVKGFVPGAVLSVISLVILAALVWADRKTRANNP